MLVRFIQTWVLHMTTNTILLSAQKLRLAGDDSLITDQSDAGGENFDTLVESGAESLGFPVSLHLLKTTGGLTSGELGQTQCQVWLNQPRYGSRQLAQENPTPIWWRQFEQVLRSINMSGTIKQHWLLVKLGAMTLKIPL